MAEGKVLVTGGAGFIGSHIVDQLCEKGYEVRVLDNLHWGRLRNIEEYIDKYNVEFVDGDIRYVYAVDKCMKDVDYVFHTAAIHIPRSVAYPRECIDVNISGSYNVFKSALDHGVKKVIFSSSSSVYGEPVELPMTEKHPMLAKEPYGASKLMCEYLLRYLEDKGLKHVSFRYFNVYGPRQAAHAYYTTAVIAFIKRILSGHPPVIDGDGSQSMDFTYVTDVARANIMAMESGVENEFFNVGTGVSTSIAQIAEILIEALGKDQEPEFRPRDVYVTKRKASYDKIKGMLGWEPEVDVKTGLTITAKHIAEYPHLYEWYGKAGH